MTLRCPYCRPIVHSEIEALYDLGHLDRRHLHRLFVVTTHNGPRMWWGTSARATAADARADHGPGVTGARPATYTDIVHAHRTGSLR